jgi:hypothetical protein
VPDPVIVPEPPADVVTWMQLPADVVTWMRARDLGRGWYREWRVTGEPGPPFPVYEFVWSEQVHPDAEQMARQFIATVGTRAELAWVTGPVLSVRWVCRLTGVWEPAPAVDAVPTVLGVGG